MLYNHSPRRKSGSKNSLKAQNYHDSPTLDDGYGVCVNFGPQMYLRLLKLCAVPVV